MCNLGKSMGGEIEDVGNYCKMRRCDLRSSNSQLGMRRQGDAGKAAQYQYN
jgi:hypothetical protein